MVAAGQQGGGPFLNWDNPAWDHPVRLLEAIRLWLPAFARRLDQVKWPSADEIPIVAQQRHRHRTLYDHPTSEHPITEAAPDSADDLIDSDVPDALRGDVTRLLREWDRWDD